MANTQIFDGSVTDMGLRCYSTLCPLHSEVQRQTNHLQGISF